MITEVVFHVKPCFILIFVNYSCAERIVDTMKSEFLDNVYFIGIGGISMSSLALILKNRGCKVAGFDFKRSENTELLEKNGIKVNYQFSEANQDGFDTVVYTAAIAADDKELVFAKERGAKIYTRAELLGDIVSGYKHSIGVAGTHGKSTTTGMLSGIMQSAKSDATVLAGAVIPALGSTYRAGNGDIAVFEACEYKNSYHAMRPTIRLVLNCEFDHVDFFGSMENVIKSFKQYMDTDSETGENVVIINADCKNTFFAAQGIDAKVYTFSVSDKGADFYADNITEVDGYMEFDIYACGEFYCKAKPSVPGMHNVSNSLGAAAAAYVCGIPGEAVSEGLQSFCGVKRRFEKLGKTAKGAVVIDDYAHHPDEVTATLTAAKKVCKGNVYCIFQPHTYTRFEALIEDFAKSLSIADKVVMADIYAAREQNTSGISAADIKKYLPDAVYVGGFEEIAGYIKENANDKDMVITMGAGDIYKAAPMILE